MRRKVLAWLLTLSMVFTMMPSLAFANTTDASVSGTQTLTETTSDDATETSEQAADANIAVVAEVADTFYVSSDYNESTEGYGVTKFGNYASAYAYAVTNNTKATIVIEKTTTLSGNTFDNNHKNYSKLAVVIKDGATMGNALSKWDMTYPVTVEPGGSIVMARPANGSVSNVHIKNTLTLGAAGSEKKATLNFLSDSYQDGDISIRYNGKIVAYNADIDVQDLDAQGSFTAENCNINVDGAFASATWYATKLTDSEMTVGGTQISGGLSDFAGGANNQLGNVTLTNSSIAFESGTVKVAATNTLNGESNITADTLEVNGSKKITLNEGASIAVSNLVKNSGTITVKEGASVEGGIVLATNTAKVVAVASNNLDVTSSVDGYKVKYNASTGTYELVDKYCVQIGEKKFESLQKAIDAANPDDTITFLTDITEDVTIDKNITIEGADKQYTGKMTISGDLNVTVQNITAVEGYIVHTGSKTTASLTIKGCSFKNGGYAVTTERIKDLTIEDCTVTNQSLLYAKLSTSNIVVKNVTIDKGNYVAHIVYGENAYFENVTATNMAAYGICTQNYGAKTITLNNCSFDAAPNYYALAVRDDRTTEADTFIFEGENKMSSLYNSTYAKYELTEEATLEAPAEANVTTTVDGCEVEYKGGKYSVVESMEKGTWGGIDWTLSNDGTLTIAPTAGEPVPDANASSRTYEVGEWREAVKYDSTGEGIAITGWPYDRTKVKTLVIEEGVTSIGSFAAQGFTNLTGEVVIPSTVTYIGQEAFQKSTFTKLTFAEGGTEELCIAQGAFKNLIIEDVALPADRPVHMHAWVFNNCHNLKTVTLPATLVSVHGTNHIDYFKDFNAHSNPTWTRSSEIFAYDENLQTITFGSEAVRDMFYASNNGTSKDYTVANVGLTTYCDLQDAIDAAQDGDTITVIKNFSTDSVTVPADKTITLDLNGKTITGKPAEAAAYAVITNKGDLTITGNGKIVCDHKLAGSTGYAVNTILNAGTLTIDGPTIENVSTASGQIGYAVDNNSTTNNAVLTIKNGEVKASGSNYYDGIRQFCNSVTNENSITVNGGEVSSIWLQNPSDGSADKNTKDVKGAVTITGGTVNYLYLEPSTAFEVAISGGDFERVSAFEVAENRMPTYFITGGTFTQCPEEVFVAKDYKAVLENGKYVVNPIPYVAQVGDKKFETLAEAVNNAEDDTVTILKDCTVSETVVINDDLTIDLAGFTVKAADTLENAPVFRILGNVTFTGGTVDGTTGINSYAFIVGKTFNAGTLTISDGTYKGITSAISITKGVVNISGGEFVTGHDDEGTDYGAQYLLNCMDAAYKAGTAEYVITGGTFYGFNPANNAAEGANTSFVAEGYVADFNSGEDTYTVRKGNFVVAIGEAKFESLATAIEAAKEGDVITVIDNFAIDEIVTVAAGKEITIDLNGKTITGTDNTEKNFSIIDNRGTLTIKDGVGEGKITLTATNNSGWNRYSAVIANNPGGKLVIESGTIEHLGGTDMAYGIDNLTNGKNTYAETVINGGTIKSPYRAIRQFLNGVEAQNILTINGGTIEGANKSVWMQDPNKNANSGTLTVGENATLKGDVYLFVTDGSTEWPVTVAINKDALAEGSEVMTGNVPAGYALAETDGVYGVAKLDYVAQIGEANYYTLAEAIAKATAGDTITLLADVNENVTVNKNLTIDGAGKDYTGTMTVNTSLTTTIQNINFVKGCITEAKGTSGKLTVKNCNFDGVDNSIAYAVTMRGGNTVTIEGGTVKNYDYGFLYVPSAVTNVNVKSVTVEDVNYGVHVAYGSKINLEDVTMTNVAYGIMTQNYGAKTVTIKNCDITATNPIHVWEREGYTAVDTFKFVGVNKLSALPDSQYAKVEGVETVNAEGATVYGDFASMVAVAKSGETVKLLSNVDVTDMVTIPNGKVITVDLNGKTITGTDNTEKNFSIIDNRGTLTIKDSVGEGKIILTATKNNGWNRYSAVIANNPGGKLVIESGTIEHLGGTDMAYGIDNLTNGKNTYAETVINGGTIKSPYRAIRQFLNGVEAQNILTINGGTIEGTNKSVWMQDPSKNANSGTLTIGKNATLKGDVYLFVTAGSTEWPVKVAIDEAALADDSEIMTGNVPAGYELAYNDGIYSVEKIKVAAIGEDKFESLQAAINAANSGDEIQLLTDINIANADTVLLDGSYNTYFKVEGKDITIDLNDKVISGAYTATDKMLVGVFSTDNNGHLTLTGNGTVDITATGKVYSLIANYEPGCSITIENGTYKLDKASDSLIYSGANVGENEGITVNGGNFELGNEGAGDNGKPWIFNVLGSNERHVTVTGGTFNTDINHQYWIHEVQLPAEKACKANGDGTWTVVDAVAYITETHSGYGHYVGYATLDEAFNAAKSGETVTVLTDIELTAPITVAADDNFTLDLNGNTISYTTAVAGEAMITNNGELIITDSTEDAKGKISFAYTGAADTAYSKGNYTITNNGKLTVENGTIENTTAKMSHAYYTIQNGNNGTFVLNDGKIVNETGYAIRQFASDSNVNTVTINGGEVSGTRAVWMQAAGSNTANEPTISLNVNGGTLTGTGETGYKLAVYSYSYGNSLKNVSVNVTGGVINGDIALTGGKNKTTAETVTISGGEFHGSADGEVYSYATDAVAGNTIGISGGTFDHPVYSAYCADGFIPKDNGNGTYTVEAGEFAAAVYAGEEFIANYVTVQEALDVAEENETVVMLKDATAKYIIVPTDVTLNLNGNVLTPDYLASFGDVVDNSEANTGKLVGSKANIMLQTTNTQLPVKVKEGIKNEYKFYEVAKINSIVPNAGEYQFVPYIDVEAHELLLNGAESTGVTINAVVTWTSTNGVRTQNFVYSDAFVNDFLNSYNTTKPGKYANAFKLYLSNADNLENVTYDALVASELGVAIRDSVK